MAKPDKFIKITYFSALILAIVLVALIFYQRMDFFSNFQAVSSWLFNKERVAAVKIENEVRARFLFVGDLMLDRQVKKKIKGHDITYLFQGLNNFDFKKYDLVSANLEGAVTNDGLHYAPTYNYDFAFAPKVIASLKDYNFKIFNLANNHLTDQGERGVTETKNNLTKLGFKYYGCRDSEVGECSFTIYNAGNFKIGFVGFSAVYKKIDSAEAGKIVSDLKDKTDLLVVNVHWGAEYEHIFSKAQTGLAHELVDAGVDIVIGHHPHVAQGLEIYKNKPIFYSLGNFIFDQYFSRDTQEELAVELAVASDGRAKVVLYPLISRASQPNLMVGREREKFLAKIAGWSKGDENILEQVRKGIVEIQW